MNGNEEALYELLCCINEINLEAKQGTQIDITSQLLTRDEEVLEKTDSNISQTNTNIQFVR